jgi:hypothetical protein
MASKSIVCIGHNRFGSLFVRYDEDRSNEIDNGKADPEHPEEIELYMLQQGSEVSATKKRKWSVLL